jgi:hypothetical protein
MAQLRSTVSPEIAARLTKVIDRRMDLYTQSPSLQVAGPMKVLSWDWPDPRKPIYDQYGALARWTSMWELGLAIVGMYAVVKNGAPPTHRSMFTTMCETLATFGCFTENGTTYQVDDILWADGEAPSGGMVTTGTQLTWRQGASQVGQWTFAGLLVALEWLGANHELATGLADYTNQITGGIDAGDRETAEWWAAVPSVRPAGVGSASRFRSLLPQNRRG